MIAQRFWYSFLLFFFGLGGLFSHAWAEQDVVDEQGVNDHYGQTIDLRLYEKPSDLIKGEIRFNTFPFSVGEVQFFLVGEDEEVLVWKEVLEDVDVKDLGEGRSGIDFELDVSGTTVSGGYYLYGGVFDSFYKRVGVGKKLLVFETKANLDTLSGAELVKGNGEGGQATLSFLPNNQNKTIRPVVEIYENSLGGSKYGRFEGDSVGISGEEPLDLTVEFPWPTVPEVYVVVARVEGDNGAFYGGEIIKRIVVEGEFAEILGIRPQKGTDLGEIQHLALEMKGYVPYGKFYDLQLALEQTNTDGVVDQKEKIVSIDSNEKASFSVVEQFSLDPQAANMQLRAQIVNPETKEVIEQKDFTWSKVAHVKTVSAQGSNAVVAVEKAPESSLDTMRLYILGAIIVILGLLMYLFFSNRKHLKALIVLPLLWGTGVSAADISGVYDTPFVNAPFKSNTSYTTDGAASDGFTQMEINGVIARNGYSKGAFEEETLESVTVSLQKPDGGYLDDFAVIDAEDVGLFQPVPGLDPWIGYRFYLDLAGQTGLDEGMYGVRVVFAFKGGRTITGVRNNYFRIDTTNPGVTITALDTTPVNGAKTLRIACSGESGHCIDQPTIGSGSLNDNNRRFDATVKGNFCDGTGDGGRFCRRNVNVRTFEVCDGAGNCTDDATPTVDLFYYDPYPPQMSTIELIRVKSDSSIPANFAREADGSISDADWIDRTGSKRHRWVRSSIDPINDLDGPPGSTIAAHGKFGFDLVDDRDDDIDVGTVVEVGGQNFTLPVGTDYAGPASDPTACGEKSWSGTPASPAYSDRDYSGKKGDFYYGRSYTSATSQCRQRVLTCTNAPGQRGYWDRSLALAPLSDVTPETCTVDGVPATPPSGSCPGTGVLTDVNNTPADTSDDVCIDCGDGFVYENGECKRINQCDPIAAEKVAGDPYAWSHEGTATSPNQAWDWKVGVYTKPGSPTSCSWGCAEGFIADPNTYRCITDCKDGKLAICAGTECFGDFCSVPVNGVCVNKTTPRSTAPSTYGDLCSSGTPTLVVPTSGGWIWDCVGGQGATSGSAAIDDKGCTAVRS